MVKKPLGLSGVGINTTPLIAFNTLIDEDFSLISYIISHIRNHDIFDLDKLKDMNIPSVIKEIYLRQYKNPLYFLMKNEKDKEFLDQCYKEFKETQEYYDYYAVATDFYDLMAVFKLSGDITPTILCNTEKEMELLAGDESLAQFSRVLKTDLKQRDMTRYGQYYFYLIDDCGDFLDDKIGSKTYYFSSCGLNLSDDKDTIVESPIIDKIRTNKSHINIFDMYKSNVIGRAIY